MDSPSNPFDEASWVDAAALLIPLRQLLGVDVSRIEDWSIDRTVAGGGDELGVWHVAGTATVNGAELPWTIYLKGWAAPESGTGPSDWNWPRRETLIYRATARSLEGLGR